MSSDIAQIFVTLWAETQEELVRASIPPRLSQSTVSYCFQVGGIDSGEYAWNGGAPSILIYRSDNLILEAERQAWQHAHAVLMRLGWTDWASFDAIQWRSLRTYSDGLAQRRS